VAIASAGNPATHPVRLEVVLVCVPHPYPSPQISMSGSLAAAAWPQFWARLPKLVGLDSGSPYAVQILQPVPPHSERAIGACTHARSTLDGVASAIVTALPGYLAEGPHAGSRRLWGQVPELPAQPARSLTSVDIRQGPGSRRS